MPPGLVSRSANRATDAPARIAIRASGTTQRGTRRSYGTDRPIHSPSMPTSAPNGPGAPMGPRTLTVVLPAYNESQRIGPALDELFAWLDANPAALPMVGVLVVDDGSTDGTADLVRARPEAARSTDGTQATLAVLPVPHAGKGAAVRAGMLDATGDLVVFADADMATPPSELPKLVTALE